MKSEALFSALHSFLMGLASISPVGTYGGLEAASKTFPSTEEQLIRTVLVYDLNNRNGSLFDAFSCVKIMLFLD